MSHSDHYTRAYHRTTTSLYEAIAKSSLHQLAAERRKDLNAERLHAEAVRALQNLLDLDPRDLDMRSVLDCVELVFEIRARARDVMK